MHATTKIMAADKILAAKRADAGAEQPSRGATACQAVSALACPAEAGRRRKRDTRTRHGTGIDERICRTRQRRLVRLGYRLYGLTKDEITLVESASAEATARREESGR